MYRQRPPTNPNSLLPRARLGGGSLRNHRPITASDSREQRASASQARLLHCVSNNRELAAQLWHPVAQVLQPPTPCNPRPSTALQTQHSNPRLYTAPQSQHSTPRPYRGPQTLHRTPRPYTVPLEPAQYLQTPHSTLTKALLTGRVEVSPTSNPLATADGL